jgi:hypothetical protein
VASEVIEALEGELGAAPGPLVVESITRATV